MNKTSKYKFNELYDFNSGISSKPEQAGHGAPFLSFSTTFNNFFIPEKLTDYMDSSTEEQKKYSILDGDIFLTRTSETIDELGISCVAIKDYPKATFSGFLKRLRPLQKNKTYAKYMAFYLRSKLFRKTMTNNAVLTLRASLNEQIFSYLDLILIDYDEQVKAGDFLYLIQAKMELNNKINTKLISMTKTIYDYWFVQFDFPDVGGIPYKSSGGKMVWNEKLKREIPEGWKILELNDIISRSGTGLNPRNNFKLGSGDKYYVTIKNIEQNIVILDDKCDKIDASAFEIIDKRSDLQVGDILFTSIQPVGVTYLIQEKPKNWNINESVFTLRPDYSKVSFEYLFLLLSGDEIKLFTENSSAGSVHKGIRHSVLKTFRLAYKDKNIIDDFSKIINPLLKKLDTINKENQQLSEFRDFLLPMLMNGQVTVS